MCTMKDDSAASNLMNLVTPASPWLWPCGVVNRKCEICEIGLFCFFLEFLLLQDSFVSSVFVVALSRLRRVLWRAAFWKMRAHFIWTPSTPCSLGSFFSYCRQHRAAWRNYLYGEVSTRFIGGREGKALWRLLRASSAPVVCCPATDLDVATSSADVPDFYINKKTE